MNSIIPKRKKLLAISLALPSLIAYAECTLNTHTEATTGDDFDAYCITADYSSHAEFLSSAADDVWGYNHYVLCSGQSGDQDQIHVFSTALTRSESWLPNYDDLGESHVYNSHGYGNARMF